MIRINLLEEARAPKGGRRAPAAAAAAAGGGTTAATILIALVYGGIIAATIGAIGVYTVMLNNQIAVLDRDIDKAKARVAELKKVIELNEELNAKRSLLRRKIEVIASLKQQQAAPVQMLDKISDNLAEYVWLETLTVQGNTRVTLTAKAQNYYAIVKFLQIHQIHVEVLIGFKKLFHVGHIVIDSLNIFGRIFLKLFNEIFAKTN